MNATDTDEITGYVEAVRAALSGLPEELRESLLEDLPEHLAEVVADDVGSLTERLGPPSVYAAELLAGAGYVGGGFPDPPAPPRRGDVLRRLGGSIGTRLRSFDQFTGPLFGRSRTSEFLLQLRPAWWVLRGYLVAMVLADGIDSGGSIGLLPRVGGSEVVAFLLLGACVVASVWFGRRSFVMRRPMRLAHWSATAVLVLVALTGFNSTDQTARNIDYYPATYADPYTNIEDVFVYDRQGNLIEGARLLDQNGQPLRLGNAWCYDEQTGGREVDQAVYPYCPENAPFRLAPSERPEPTATR